MIYSNIKKAVFVARPNRFIAEITIEGTPHIAHVKNTGRCKELLLPGCTIWVEEFDSPHRKTKFDLIAVQKGDMLINMDSQAPNKVFGEWAAAGGFLPNITLIKPETRYENSRFDFYLEAGEDKIFVEVKGVTLEENGVVLFPDAPTLRGIKHLEELCHAAQSGFKAYAVFVVQLEKAKHFTPNNRTHKAFGDALQAAQQAGVHIVALSCTVTPTSLKIAAPLEVRL